MYQDSYNRLDMLHLLGQVAARKAAAEGLPYEMVHDSLAETLTTALKSRTLNEEGYAGVHSATWTLLLLHMPVKPDPAVFWDYAFATACASYDDLPADTGAAMCVHGIGLAAMFIAVEIAQGSARAARSGVLQLRSCVCILVTRPRNSFDFNRGYAQRSDCAMVSLSTTNTCAEADYI